MRGYCLCSSEGFYHPNWRVLPSKMKSFIVQNEEFYRPNRRVLPSAGRVKPSKMEDFTRFHRPKWRVLQSKMKGFTIQNEGFYHPKWKVLPSKIKGFTIHNEEFCLQKPTLFITLTGKIFAKSQKFKKSKSFRLFEFSVFFDFSSRNLLEWELFDFSTFRGRKSCYQPEEHTAWPKLPGNPRTDGGSFTPSIWHYYLSILHHIIRIQSHDFPSSRKNASP